MEGGGEEVRDESVQRRVARTVTGVVPSEGLARTVELMGK